MKVKLLAVILNPFIISLFMSVIIVLLLPNIFNKYKIELISKEVLQNKNETIYYADLNNDGISEKIQLMQNNPELNSLVAYTNDKVIDQWNIAGKRLTDFSDFWGDYDNDGKKEIITYSLSGDSIYLNCISPFNNKKMILSRAITDYTKRYNQTNFTTSTIGFYDKNNDGLKELYFALHASYSGYPRRMYSFDFANNAIKSSPIAGMNFLNPFAINLNDNSSLKLASSVQAPGNCSVDYPYTDYYTWLMLFDKELNFVFEPVKINAHPSTLDVEHVSWNNKDYLLMFNSYQGTNNFKSSMLLYDLNGIKVKELELPENDVWNSTCYLNSSSNNGSDPFIITSTGSIYKIEKDLGGITLINKIEALTASFNEYDIGGDKKNEFIVKPKNADQVYILQNDLKGFVTVDIAGSNYVKHCSVIKNGDKNCLYIEAENSAYVYAYSENVFFYLKYIIYLTIYFGFAGLFYLLQRVQKIRAEQKYRSERKIAELQIRSLKNQIDPHFTLNILNSIGALYYQQNKDTADYIFGKYSKLLRNTILNSDKVLSSINEEIDYIENYLNLEKYRLANKFEFEIQIDDNVDTTKLIPKTLIHTFVENSIKHGIRHLNTEGKVSISIRTEGAYYVIKVSDNGMGRKHAEVVNSSGTGKGLKILNEILDLYYNMEGIRITYSMNNVLDESNLITGTEVKIKIPNK